MSNCAHALMDLLRCPICSGALISRIENLWNCVSCDASYPLIQGIPNFVPAGDKGTMLDKMDYDAVHMLDSRAITSIGVEWTEVLRALDATGGDMMEIGAGTGALTRGLLQQGVARSLVATDVSMKFMLGLKSILIDDNRVEFVVCDANTLNFSSGVFDVVVGRSILHHLVGFERTIALTAQLLRPGGIAVFFEPILQGKIVPALFAKLMLEADRNHSDPVLSEKDKNRVSAFVRHITKASWYPQDAQSLSKIEDKYIFDLTDMERLAQEAGYARFSVHRREEPPLDVSYWSYFLQHMRILGVDVSKLARFSWIGDSFAATWGLMLRHQLVKPMSFLVFHK